MTYPELLAQLTVALAGPLPGPDAQARMAPQPRGGWPEGYAPEHLRHAAGLILLFPVAGQPHLVLTVRSSTVRHAGQVSLPGGVIEPGESAEQAAVREAREEVDCPSDVVRVLGRLTPVDIPVSAFRLHPIVATTAVKPVLTASDGEVARIVELPLDTLLDPAARSRRRMQRGPLTLDVPVFQVDDVTIWGATAMVLAELLALFGWPDRRS